MEKGLTLVELILVIVIVGILAGIAFPNYRTMKEREYDREASANLRLVMVAEKNYRMETNEYWVAVDTSSINANLRLALPTGTNVIWNYQTVSSDPTSNCCAQATRTTAGGGTAHNLYLRNTDDPNKDLSQYQGACP